MSKVGACVDTTLTWIGNNKMVTFLGLVAFSLMVSTWTLAAINVQLNDEIDDLNYKLNPTTVAPTTVAPTTIPQVSDAPTEKPTDAPTTAAPTEPPTTNLRLSEFVVPTLYDLLIYPDLTPGDGGGRFTGNVKISLDVSQATNEIILHAHELNITEVKFKGPDSAIRVVNYQLIAELEQVKVTLSAQISAGTNYELELFFNGNMRGKIVGLYSSTYKDKNGDER